MRYLFFVKTPIAWNVIVRKEYINLKDFYANNHLIIDYIFKLGNRANRTKYLIMY